MKGRMSKAVGTVVAFGALSGPMFGTLASYSGAGAGTPLSRTARRVPRQRRLLEHVEGPVDFLQLAVDEDELRRERGNVPNHVEVRGVELLMRRGGLEVLAGRARPAQRKRAAFERREACVHVGRRAPHGKVLRARPRERRERAARCEKKNARRDDFHPGSIRSRFTPPALPGAPRRLRSSRARAARTPRPTRARARAGTAW